MIDDEDDSRELLRRTLTGAGYAVLAAAGGSEGLEQARNRPPAAITLDVMMPSMDGWAVLRELKADPTLRDVPVIMVSIVSEKGMGFTLGAADYLTKPVDRKLLVETVHRFAGCGAPKVLVIEDDEPTRSMIRRTLEDGGVNVSEAENGAVGLERLAEERPHLVLLDLMMPVMDGMEFLARMRTTEHGRDLPVLVLTAKELDPQERDFLENNTRSVLGKHELALDQLVARVRASMSGSAETS